jgi:hypothetical protein
MRKTTATLLIFTLTFSLLWFVGSSFSNPTTPVIPEFTVTLVTNVYHHPAIYSIDPYTGQNITSAPAENVEGKSIFIKIKNEPFTAYTNENGHLIELYYHVRAKGHFSDSWNIVHPLGIDGYPKAVSSDFTELEFGADNYPTNAVVDFQVEAMIGYVNNTLSSPYYHYEPVFEGQVSGWSDTQSIPINSSEVSETLSDSPAVHSQSNLQDNFFFDLGLFGFAIAILIIVILLVVVVVFLLKRRAG